MTGGQSASCVGDCAVPSIQPAPKVAGPPAAQPARTLCRSDLPPHLSPLQQDSAHCNAGRGSNISFGGVVECDASVMAGDGTFGAIAAAPGGLVGGLIEHTAAEPQPSSLC